LHGGVAKIVALGGGAFVKKGNAALLRSAGVPAVFLDAPVEELWRRCQSETGRESPLLKTFELFRDLYRNRRKSYLQAATRIETDGRPVEAIAAEIAQRLDLKEIRMRTEQGEAE
jgi:shikimate kinase